LLTIAQNAAAARAMHSAHIRVVTFLVCHSFGHSAHRTVTACLISMILISLVAGSPPPDVADNRAALCVVHLRPTAAVVRDGAVQVQRRAAHDRIDDRVSARHDLAMRCAMAGYREDSGQQCV
jgi:hypothetical protein